MSISNVGKRLGWWGAVCGLVLAGFCWSGCRTQAPEQQFAEVPPGLSASSGVGSGAANAPKPAAESATIPVAAPATTPVAVPTTSPMASSAPTGASNPGTDLLRVGETLIVTLTDTPVTIPPFQGPIGEDGTITLTLNQVFKVTGKSTGDLAKDIRDRYVPRYYKYMTVSVNHLESTRWYYVDGEVKAPNREIWNIPITVRDAVASAGGFTDFANKKKVKLTRVDGSSQVINCVKALDNPALDVEVRPGDKIHVPRKLW
jgi:polysaccharide export outer membrane protein